MNDNDKLVNFLNTHTVEEIENILYQYKDVELLPKQLGLIFEKLYFGDKYEITDIPPTKFLDNKELSIDYLVSINNKFKTENGCQWARSDTSYLAKRYDIKRKVSKGRVSSISLSPKQTYLVKDIPSKVRQFFKDAKCVILDTNSSIEIDHKDGRHGEIDKNDKNNYQPLTKNANDAKRQHCKRCKETGIRYDATQLGYSAPQVSGDPLYDEEQKCIGCYWHDPRYFNETISKNFEKKN